MEFQQESRQQALYRIDDKYRTFGKAGQAEKKCNENAVEIWA